jgi:hypothetical protein
MKVQETVTSRCGRDTVNGYGEIFMYASLGITGRRVFTGD